METIFYNGKIITMTKKSSAEEILDMPEAVLVKDGIIASVGTLENVRMDAGVSVIEYNLQGNCLMPSFIDSHSHIVMNGQISLYANLSECRSNKDIILALKKYLSDHEITKEGLVLGFGYDNNLLDDEMHPDKRILDLVSEEIPILIIHVSGHFVCGNSAILKLAGITEDTENPTGGVIGRLEDGKQPSGYLEETAVELVKRVIVERAKFEFSSIVENMQEAYIKNGITTAQDGATVKNDLEILKKAATEGTLKIDVITYPIMSNGGIELMKDNANLRYSYDHHLKIGGYKLVLDGSPQGKSAWLSEPYISGRLNEKYCGYPLLSDEEIEKFVEIAIKEKQQLLVHCNGDAASEQFLRVYEKANPQNVYSLDLRPVMIHCQTVRNDQLDRMRKIGMIASIFIGHVWFWGDIHKKNLGLKRGNHISPAKDAFDRGVVVNFHQDTPVTPPNMLHSIWCAVNRLSRNDVSIGEEQKISVYKALQAVTINAAYQYFEEDTKGSIKVGKRADLVVLDDSPLEVDLIEIQNIKVLKTIKDGKVIYEG